MQKVPQQTYRYILALDPSGSFYEGKGTTGYCLFDVQLNKFITCGSLFAKHHTSMEQYWDTVVNLIITVYNQYPNMYLVCEDYLLYATKLQDQINSRMETPKLIGVIQHLCWKLQIPYYMQTAAEVKKRWSDHILEHKGYIHYVRKRYEPTSGDLSTYTHHSLDAIRHAIHFATFKIKKYL